MRRLAIIAIAAAISLVPAASNAEGATVSKYAGEETREIKSLSPDDIAELRRGGGWGLAKAAELNGVPGPAHLLEMKNEIPLTAEQIAALEAVYEDMTARAIAAGERLIALEQQLDRQFADRTITDEGLRAQLAEIAVVQSALRYVHLSTHLKTPAILTEAQIARYNALRGYGGNDPCAAVPAGHDPAMWRQHNGCD
jgi:hypothetical protein